MLKRLISLWLILSFTGGLTASNLPVLSVNTEVKGEHTPMKAWYSSPASNWESEALPIGNGFIGGMVYGGSDIDHIQINENTVWSGGPGKNANYSNDLYKNNTSEQVKQALREFQQTLQQNMLDFDASSKAYIDPDTGQIVTKNYPATVADTQYPLSPLKGNKNDFGSYQTLGDIYIEDTNSMKPKLEGATSSAEPSDNSGQYAANMFDGNTVSKWYAGNSTEAKAGKLVWPVIVSWHYNRPFFAESYEICSAADDYGRDPSEWKLYGSNDKEEYTLIDTRAGVVFPGRQRALSFEFENPVSYQYFKLEVVETTQHNPPQISEIRLISAAEQNNPDEYERGLDLDKAVAWEEYVQDGITYSKEYFVSNPDNVMVIRLTANEAGKLNRKFSFDSLQPNKTITASGDTLTMTGRPSDHQASYTDNKRLIFAQQMKVMPSGENASISTNGKNIEVADADEILLIMSAGTNYIQCMDETYNYFSDENPLNTVNARINSAADKDYNALLNTHIEDYSRLFNRVKLNLCGAEFPENKTTDALLKGYQENTNTDGENRYLEMLYYQFGRYLLIASSREGSLPANLQGIWAQGLSNPWNADYHTNINVQMNYWLAEQTNLSECHTPLIEYIKSLVPQGTKTAQYYHQKQNGGDVRGWTIYHENNIWGGVVPATSGAFYFPAAAAWMCQHIWEQYAFTMDKKVLEDNYRIMLDAALFWVDFLWEDERDGSLVANPSWSPEHGPYSLGSSADQTIIWELFEQIIKASEVLGEQSSELEEVKEAQSRLWLPEIGLNGQYMEWKDEVTLDVTGDGGHRHVNHLYALHPGTLVVAGRSEKDDENAEAMKVTLNTRGDGGVGWSKAWKINFWARLRDGNRAGTLVNEIIKESTYPNLFDVCPPFQIDGNFGATAGMTEMLIQSQGDSIDLMAAVPAIWDSGNVSGIKARGNFEIDMEWEERILQSASVKSLSGTDCILNYSELSQATVINDKSGQKIEFDIIDKNTISFETERGESYIITGLSQDIKYSDPHSFARAEINNLYNDKIISKVEAPGEIKNNGVYIEGFSDGSLLESLGMRENDIITKINGYTVTDTKQLLKIYGDIPEDNEVILKVWRENRYIKIIFIKSETNGSVTLPGLIQAENYTEKTVRIDGTMEYPRTQDCGDINGGKNISHIADGDWFAYKNVYISQTPLTVNFRGSNASANNFRVYLRIGSKEAEPVASYNISNTGGWQIYRDCIADITAQIEPGVYDIYLTFSGGININWFSLNADNPEEIPYDGPENPPGCKKGDVNGDSSINIFDIMEIRDHIFGKKTLSGDPAIAADVNVDLSINIFDIMMIRDYIFGKVTEL